MTTVAYGHRPNENKEVIDHKYQITFDDTIIILNGPIYEELSYGEDS